MQVLFTPEIYYFLNDFRMQQFTQFITRFHRVPTQTGKPAKMGRHFPVRVKSGNFRQILFAIFLVIFKLTVYYLLNWIKFSVKKQSINIKKILEKSGNFVSPEKWEP